MRLSEVAVGQQVTIKSLDSNIIDRNKLYDLGLLPGTLVIVENNIRWSRSLKLAFRQSNLIVRHSLAAEIEVQVIK